MTARIRSFALVGWRGITYLELPLDDGPMTGLIGMPGAGKTTAAMCLCYALLPDRNVMHITPISAVADAHQAGVDAFAARIDPDVGYAYVLLDIQSNEGARLIAGIHVRLVDGTGYFTPLRITSPPDWPLQDFLRVIEGDSESYPDLPALATGLAERGVTLRECRTVREYGETLHEAGILPCDMAETQDRTLYARLIESAFRGGLTKEVASQVKTYLLPPASRIPESIGRLQKCADSMMRTRSSLSTAEQQLHLLESTFGLGKSIVSRALAEIDTQMAENQERGRTARADLARHAETLQSIEASLADIVQTAEVTATTKQTIEAEFGSELQACTQAQLELKTQVLSLATAKNEAQSSLDRFNAGRTAWKAVTENRPAAYRDPDHLESVLTERVEARLRDKIELERTLGDLQIQREVLAQGLTESSAAALADALQADSLEEAFDDVNEQDALALEMSLGGLVTGVAGVDLSVLAALPDDPSLPDTFWLRTRLPEPVEPQKVGAWYVAPSAGGFLVTSARRRLTFGKQARARRIQEIDKELETLRGRLLQATDAEKRALSLRDQLIRQREAIGFHLTHLADEATLVSAVQDAQDSAARAAKDLERSVQRQSELNHLRQQKTLAIDLQLRSLDAQRTRALQRQDETKRAHDAAAQEARSADAALQERTETATRARAAVGEDATWLARAIAEDRQLRDQYLTRQATDLTSLMHALADEPGDRLGWLSRASADDPVSCCAIWPPLKSLVSERVSVEALDKDGTDLLGAMADRRRRFSEQLDHDRIELKSEAKSLYAVITTEIRKQERRIKAISEFGQSLEFGNVKGIRIRSEQRKDLLTKLLAVTDQLDFFAQHHSKDLDEDLAELFEKTLGIRLGKGESLLDYRTYLDLYIEVKRGDWTPASGLSGGESIGSGLAVALMLAKSLAQRGQDSKSSKFSPLFVIDEVQRLDAEGHGVIVRFGQEQGMQVLVTALSLDARYDCTLHVMGRTRDNMVVSRRLKYVPARPNPGRPAGA